MATQQIEPIDPVTLSVINNAFVNVCREMGTAMMRTSYSPIFNEGLDFSCMLFNTARRPDRPGRVLPDHARLLPVRDEVDARRGRPRRLRAGRRLHPQRSVPRPVPHARAPGGQGGLLGTADPGGSSATSPTSARSAEWRPAPSPPMRPKSTRKASACRRSRSWRAASTSKTSGGLCWPTTARRRRAGATTTR